MSPERISVGSLSEAWPTAPRPGIDAPLILERSFPFLAQETAFEPAEVETRALAALPAPFRPIFEVRKVGGVLEVVQERFVGLSSQQLVATLTKGRRLLPLDVWLGLAELLCRAWGSVPAGSTAWRMVPTIASFGVDVRRRLLVFPQPQHSIEMGLTRFAALTTAALPQYENHSPEHVAQGPLDERARVFSLATVLVELLTGDRPFHRTATLATLQAILTEEARWRWTHHPQCPAALGKVLGGAMARRAAERPESLEVLRVLLLEAAGCAPASTNRIANVVLGVDPKALRATLLSLRAQPEFLPASWRDGGIDVLEDQLLETLVPFEQLPISRAPQEPSSPRVNLAGSGPASPPRVNLAPVTPNAWPRVNLAPAPRPWWQALWPFRR